MCRVISDYQNHGLVLPNKRGRKSTIEARHLRALELYVLSKVGKVITLEMMKAYLENQFEKESLNLSKASVFRMLRKLNISRKRASKDKVDLNSEALKLIRYQRSESLIEYIKTGCELIYLDESSFNTDICPIYGYSKRNCAFKVREYPKGRNLSLLAAMTENELLGFMLFETSVKGVDFGSFILQIIANHTKIAKNLSKTIWYCDNAVIHKALILGDLFTKIRIFYGPPYAAFLNPIEHAFGLWKHYVRKIGHTCRSSLIQAIIEASFWFKAKDFHGFVRNCLRFWMKSLLKENI